MGEPWKNRIVATGEESPDQLLANPANWRVHPKAQQDALASVLDEVGWVQRVIVNKTTSHVVDGHLRVALALSREEPTIPVSYVELSAAEEQMVLATFDPLAAMAATDKNKLAELLRQAEIHDAGLREALNDTAGIIEEPTSGNTDPDDVPEERSTDIQRGDLFELGSHRLLCGDSTNADDVARLMNDNDAAMMVADPPYGVSYADKNDFLNSVDKGNQNQTPITGDHQTPDEMSQFWVSAFTTIRVVMATGASYYVTGPQGGDLLLLLLALKQSDFPLRHMLIWAKNNHVLGRCDYNYKHEPIIFGWVEGSHQFNKQGHDTSVWEIDKPHGSKHHPTMKPVEIWQRAICNSSQINEIVLDPFAGSGTAILAAEQLDRRCYAIEIEPTYCQVTIDRWEAFTGKTAKKVNYERSKTKTNRDQTARRQSRKTKDQS